MRQRPCSRWSSPKLFFPGQVGEHVHAHRTLAGRLPPTTTQAVGRAATHCTRTPTKQSSHARTHFRNTKLPASPITAIQCRSSDVMSLSCATPEPTARRARRAGQAAVKTTGAEPRRAPAAGAQVGPLAAASPASSVRTGGGQPEGRTAGRRPTGGRRVVVRRGAAALTWPQLQQCSGAGCDPSSPLFRVALLWFAAPQTTTCCARAFLLLMQHSSASSAASQGQPALFRARRGARGGHVRHHRPQRVRCGAQRAHRARPGASRQG